MFSLIVQNQHWYHNCVLSCTIARTALHLRHINTFQQSGRVVSYLLVLDGSRTDGVVTVGSRGVKIAFRSEIGVSISRSVDGTCGVRQSGPPQAAGQKARVVFVGHNLHQLERRRHVCSDRQSELAQAAGQKARVAFVVESLYQLQRRWYKARVRRSHAEYIF